MNATARARIGATAMHARYPGVEVTKNARQASTDRLNARLCEQYGIPADAPDFATRLKNARRSYFGGLSKTSAEKRAARAGGNAR